MSSSPKFDMNISENLSEPSLSTALSSSTTDEESSTYLPTEASSLGPTTMPPVESNLSVAYTVSESIVSILAVFGNALVVYIFCKNRSLRRYRNYYIVALAIADFLVGLLGIPFAILASVGLPRNLYGCLFTVSILMVLCTVSILCLVAVSIDRYWATTNPFAYYRNMTTTTAVSIILFCWVAGAIIGFLPLFGWYNRAGWERYPPEYCFFTDVMSYSYLVFLYFATIVFPALLMIGFYGYIYHVVLIKIRQKGTFAPQQLRRFSEQSRTGSLSMENRSATQMLRMMVSEKRREGKAAKKLGIIVLFFMLCWMPLYTINCIQAFYPIHVPIEVLNFTIILSHANSALNPFLYAYHLKEFRLAMKNALLSLLSKVCCGLVSTNSGNDYPLGPMSRSLTIPSLGHVSTIPNPHAGGRVSIKFRKIGRPDDARSVQISPPMRNNINSLIPPATYTATATASRGKFLCSAGGNDKSLTSLSLGSDCSANQVLEFPLQVSPSYGVGKCSSPRYVHQHYHQHHHQHNHLHQSQSNGNSNEKKREKCNGNNGQSPYYNHFTLSSPPSPSRTTPSPSPPTATMQLAVTAAPIKPEEGDTICNKSGQESLLSIPEEMMEEQDENKEKESSVMTTTDVVINCEEESENDEICKNVTVAVVAIANSQCSSDSESIPQSPSRNHLLLEDKTLPSPSSSMLGEECEDGEGRRSESETHFIIGKAAFENDHRKENGVAGADENSEQVLEENHHDHVLLTNSNEAEEQSRSWKSSHGDSQNAKGDPSSPIVVLKQKKQQMLPTQWQDKQQNGFDINKMNSVTQGSNGISLEG